MTSDSHLETAAKDLFERLIDQSPGNPKENLSREGSSNAGILRSVRRNLLWLLNSKANDSNDPIFQCSLASMSVLNFGIRDFAGMTEGQLRVGEFEREIERAIKIFEPRIEPNSIRVTARRSHRASEQSHLKTEIFGMVNYRGVREQFSFIPKLDLESGHFEL